MRFKAPLGQVLIEIYISTLGRCFNVFVLEQGTLPSHASLQYMGHGRTEMAICAISSICQNGCRTGFEEVQQPGGKL